MSRMIAGRSVSVISMSPTIAVRPLTKRLQTVEELIGWSHTETRGTTTERSFPVASRLHMPSTLYPSLACAMNLWCAVFRSWDASAGSMMGYRLPVSAVPRPVILTP